MNPYQDKQMINDCSDLKQVLANPERFKEPLINYLRCYCCVKNQLKMRIYDL